MARFVQDPYGGGMVKQSVEVRFPPTSAPERIRDVAHLGAGDVFTVLSSDRSTAYLVVILATPSKSGLAEWCSCPATVECRHIKLAREQHGEVLFQIPLRHLPQKGDTVRVEFGEESQ